MLMLILCQGVRPRTMKQGLFQAKDGQAWKHISARMLKRTGVA